MPITFDKAYLYGEQNILVSANQMLVQGREIQMGDYHPMKITKQARTNTLNIKLSGLNSQNHRNRTSKKVSFGDAKAQAG